MEANQIIQAFTTVVRKQDFVFSSEAIANIPRLQQKIAELETKPLQEVAEAIRQWYIDYEDVRDAVLDAVLLEQREIVKIRKTKPENYENTQENRYRVVQDELKNLQERKTQPQQT